MNQRRDNILILVGLLLALVVTGTIGYTVFLDLGLMDALYMTVITISTVGYGELGVMNMEAKLFSILLIFISLGTVGYLFSTIVSALLEGDLKKAWRRRKMETAIHKLSDHYIVCGAGQTGYNAILQFVEGQVPLVVIDLDEERVNRLVEKGIPALVGDASQEEVLAKANIHRAKGLISSLSTDAANVYTVLTARQMNPALYIVSRAINPQADVKLQQAGADNTISPNEIGGSRMASLMLRPSVMSFLDVITHAGQVVLDLEQVRIYPGSDLLGRPLKEARIPERTGLVILALKKAGQEELTFNPSSDSLLEEGDDMIVLGRVEQVAVLRKIARDD